ncbi:MAG: hypothetical protein LBK25_02265, partial [Treponema sp.]|nr:hypothetical protein [Treponema sp.]
MKLKRLVQLFGMAALAAIVTTACPTDAGGGGSELTGTVTIEGTPAVGETLTANTIALGGSGTIFYQWFLAGDPISDATGKTYLVKAVDAGKTINVRVTRAGYSG